MKHSYLSQSVLQDDGGGLKSAVTSCQEPPELLDVLVLSSIPGNALWYHIRRSTTLVRLGSLLLRVLLAGDGLGFVLVHCERTCVECCDNVDHHHTPLHKRYSSSDSSTTPPTLYNSCQGHRRSELQCQSPGYFCSPDSQCCSSDSPDIKRIL